MGSMQTVTFGGTSGAAVPLRLADRIGFAWQSGDMVRGTSVEDVFHGRQANASGSGGLARDDYSISIAVQTCQRIRGQGIGMVQLRSLGGCYDLGGLAAELGL